MTCNVFGGTSSLTA